MSKLEIDNISAKSINVKDEYTFPTTDGSADQTLVTNGSGVVTWQNQSGTSATTDSHYAMIHVFG